jgi:hypothetical protein
LAKNSTLKTSHMMNTNLKGTTELPKKVTRAAVIRMPMDL